MASECGRGAGSERMMARFVTLNHPSVRLSAVVKESARCGQSAVAPDPHGRVWCGANNPWGEVGTEQEMNAHRHNFRFYGIFPDSTPNTWRQGLVGMLLQLCCDQNSGIIAF